MTRRRAAGLAALAVFIALVCAGALWLRRTLPDLLRSAQERIRGEASALGLRVSYGDVRLRLITPNLSLESVTVEDAAAGTPVMRAERVDATVSFRSLLFGGPPVSRVRVQGYTVTLDERNRPLFDRLRSRTGERQRETPEILLLDGTVRIGPLGPVARFEARAAEIHIRERPFSGTRLTFQWDGASGDIAPGRPWGGAWPFPTGTADLSVHEGRVRIRRLAGRGGYASLRISGTVEPGGRSGDLRLSGDADAAKWVSAGAPGGAALSRWLRRGRVAFSASVEGGVSEPAGSAKVLLSDARLAGNVPAEAEIVVSASGRRVRVESLRAKVLGGALEGSAEFDLASSRGEAALALRSADLGSVPWGAAGTPVRPVGTGTVDVRLSGTPSRAGFRAVASASAGLEIRVGPGADAVPVRLPARAAAAGELRSGRELALSDFSIDLGGARLAGSGSADLSAREVSLRGTVAVPAGRAAEYGWDYPLGWERIFADWKFEGPASRPRLSGRVEALGLAARAMPPVAAVVRLEGDSADVMHFAADVPSPLARVTAVGTVTAPLSPDPFHLEATVSARDVDLSQGARWARAALASLGGDPRNVPRVADDAVGAGSADLRIELRKGSFAAQGAAEIPEAALRTAALRRVRLQGKCEVGAGGVAWNADAGGEIAGGTFKAAGRGGGSSAAIDGVFEGLDVARALRAVGAVETAGLGGSATVRFEAGRTADVWEIRRLSAFSQGIVARGVRWERVSAAGSLGAASGKLVVTSASPEVRVEAEIGRAAGWPVAATLSARGVPTGALLAAAGRAPAGSGGTWTVRASGSFRAGELLGAGAVSAGAVESLRFSAAADDVSVSGVTFRSLRAAGEKEDSSIRGAIRTASPDSDLSFTVGLRDPFTFRVAGPFALSTGRDGESGGNGTPRLEVSGRIDAGGSLRAPEKTAGTLHVARLRFRNYGVEVTGRGIDAALGADGVRLAGGTVEAGGNPLRISGKVAWDGTLDVRAGGKVPAAAVRMATDVFDRLDGVITGEVRLTGRLSDPTVVGTGRLDGGAFSFRGYAQLFEDMTAEAVISREKIIFEHFEGRSGGGTLDGWGEVPLRFDGGRRFYFSVDFFDMQYPYPDDFRPVVQGHVELLGPVNDLLVTGEVEVRSARYTRTVRPEKALVDFRRRVADVTARREQGEFRVRLDIDVIADGTIRIKNNLADAWAKGEFKVAGDSNRVIILGAFDVLEGTIDYRGNKYEVKRLTVDFQDPRRNNPRIDGRAETRKGNVTIAVSVTGTLDKYEVEFASDPPLSKNSIVSLLSLGVPAEALAGSEGSVGAGAAASVALGPYKGRVEEEIRGIVGLDKFAIEPVFSSASKSVESRFTVGKEFGERFSVTFSTNVGGTTPESAAAAEFKVGEHMYLQGGWQSSADAPEGAVGGDVKFRYRYRQFKDFLRRDAE